MEYEVRFPGGRAFAGDYLGIRFAGGAGRTEDPWLASQCARRGLEVRPVKQQKPKKLK